MLVHRRNGFGLVELLMVVAIIGILAAINTPALLRARASANEAAALASLRAINSAQRAFAASCASGFYAPTLESLGKAPEGRGDAFLSPDLAAPTPVTKSGYELALEGEPPEVAPSDDACNHDNGGPDSSELIEGYFATAVAQGSFSGSRNFWTNTTGSLFEKAREAPFISRNLTGAPEDDPDASVAQSSPNTGKAKPNAHTIQRP